MGEQVIGLSRNRRPLRYAIPPLAVVFGLIMAIQQPFFSATHLVVLVLGLLVFFALYKFLANYYGTAYDAENFYLLRPTGTEAIPLAQVFSIKLAMPFLYNKLVWDISFWGRKQPKANCADTAPLPKLSWQSYYGVSEGRSIAKPASHLRQTLSLFLTWASSRFFAQKCFRRLFPKPRPPRAGRGFFLEESLGGPVRPLEAVGPVGP